MLDVNVGGGAVCRRSIWGAEEGEDEEEEGEDEDGGEVWQGGRMAPYGVSRGHGPVARWKIVQRERGKVSERELVCLGVT